MPFARTLRIRASRHRTQKSSSGCACRSASSVRPSASVSGGTGSSLVAGGGGGDGGAGRRKGTTLGYVKSTWAELVARSERPVLGGSGSGSGFLPGSGGECVGRLGSHVQRRASSCAAATMAKRRPGKPHTHDTTTTNNNNNSKDINNRLGSHSKSNGKAAKSSPSSSNLAPSWPSTATLVIAAVLAVLAVVGPVIVLKDFGFKSLWNGDSSSSSSSPFSSSSGPSSRINGGWRLADAEAVAKLDSDVCNIDRVSVRDLDSERFEREFRYKRPVIVTFPNGASDWTEPDKWSVEQLTRSYGEWKIASGSSMEIVRRGGNGDVISSLTDFTDRVMQRTEVTSEQPTYYMFDREFFFDSDLPATFKLPLYFSSDTTLCDSIFFLGASGSGVVFHKHSDTWNAVVFGRKRWFLYPMTNTPPGGVYHGYDIMDWYERVYPNLTDRQRPLECAQQGGEILYLPEGFYHATLNIGDTVAVALQKKLPTLVAEKLMYDVTALNKELNDPNKDHKEIHHKILNDFLKLRELLPESTEVIMKLGEKYGDLGSHNRAVELLKKATELDPYFVLAYTALGNNLAILGRYADAEEALKRAIALSPGVWDVYKDYGMFLLNRGRFADAVPIFEKGTELNPELLPFWTYLQRAQQKSGDLEGAKQSQLKIDELKRQEEGRN